MFSPRDTPTHRGKGTATTHDATRQRLGTFQVTDGGLPFGFDVQTTEQQTVGNAPFPRRDLARLDPRYQPTQQPVQPMSRPAQSRYPPEFPSTASHAAYSTLHSDAGTPIDPATVDWQSANLPLSVHEGFSALPAGSDASVFGYPTEQGTSGFYVDGYVSPVSQGAPPSAYEVYSPWPGPSDSTGLNTPYSAVLSSPISPSNEGQLAETLDGFLSNYEAVSVGQLEAVDGWQQHWHLQQQQQHQHHQHHDQEQAQELQHQLLQQQKKQKMKPEPKPPRHKRAKTATDDPRTSLPSTTRPHAGPPQPTAKSTSGTTNVYTGPTTSKKTVTTTTNTEPATKSATATANTPKPTPTAATTTSKANPTTTTAAQPTKLRSASRASKNARPRPHETPRERSSRTSHNLVEKQYRSRLNAQFETLMNTLPEAMRMMHTSTTTVPGGSGGRGGSGVDGHGVTGEKGGVTIEDVKGGRQSGADGYGDEDGGADELPYHQGTPTTPADDVSGERRLSKAQVLDMSARYIRQLEQERDKLEEEREQLLENVRRLSARCLGEGSGG